jgi:hypothetical protein
MVHIMNQLEEMNISLSFPNIFKVFCYLKRIHWFEKNIIGLKDRCAVIKKKKKKKKTKGFIFWSIFR